MKLVLNSKFQTPNGSELLKSLKNAKSEWKSKTPMQKWCYFYSLGKIPFAMLRVPLLNDVNHVHWFGYFVFVYMIVDFFLMIYTIIYYAQRGETQMGLPSICIAFVALGVRMEKMLSLALINRKNIYF